ncbi:MAG: VOC family protein [Candidatus Saccharimonadales bacterium]
MNNKIWLNFPAKDIEVTAKFFNDIGFTEMDMHKGNPVMRGFTVEGSDVAIMMITEDMMKNFTQGEISDTKLGSEVLINIALNSVEEVDEFYKKVKSAGATFFGGTEPSWAGGWMYTFGFSDPSGHKWAPMFMDMSKFPA